MARLEVFEGGSSATQAWKRFRLDTIGLRLSAKPASRGQRTQSVVRLPQLVHVAGEARNQRDSHCRPYHPTVRID
jgi:hypothetical protein